MYVFFSHIIVQQAISFPSSPLLNIQSGSEAVKEKIVNKELKGSEAAQHGRFQSAMQIARNMKDD